MSNDNLEEKDAAQTGAKASASATATATAETGTHFTSAEADSQAAAAEQLQADVEKFKDLALRTQADFENFRKRSLRDKEDAVKSANAALLERLIPVLDNFEFGLQAARAEGSKGVVIGFEMVSKQLQDFLANSGVEVIDAEGKPFDPNLHDALGQESSDTVAEGLVLRQIRKGYKLKERLIRPANVFVSKGPATA
jgi:molecular chaperone GrpE